MKKLLGMVAGSFLLALVFLVPGARAATEVSGDILVDTTWTVGNSPYIITNSFSIPSGITLNIDPGVIIKVNEPSNFTNPYQSFDINGTVNSNGTSSNPVFFTSLSDDSIGGDTNGDGNSAPQHWVSMNFLPGSVGRLSSTNIRYGGFWDQSWCLNLWGPYPQACNRAALYNNGGNITLVDANISNSWTYGLQQTAGLSTITQSEFNNQSVGLEYNGGSVEIKQSKIYDNFNYGIYNSTNGAVSAHNNWWGDPSGPYNANSNPNGTGQVVSDNVDFTPWLTSDDIGPIISNSAPTISYSTAYPNGLATSTFNAPDQPQFKITYADQDNDPATQMDVVVNSTTYPMTQSSSTDWKGGVDFTFQPAVGTFASGTYSYHFGASDGVNTVRVPESGEMGFEVFNTIQTAALSYVDVPGYNAPTEPENGKGIDPNKGVADKDVLTFKAVYQGDSAPESVNADISQTIPLEKKFFTQLPYVSETDSGRLKKVDNSIRPGLPADAVGYHTGLLDYLGFDKDESFEFTPGGHPKREATADIYVSKVVNGSGSAYLKASLSAFDSSGALVVSSEKSIDVSTLAAGAFLSEKLSVVSQSDDIVKIKFKVIDISGSIIGIDAEAWVKSLSFKEELPMTRASLVDPDYKTGETFTASSVFPKGEYAYAFTASSTDGQVARLPATGSLSFTTGYSSVAFLPGIKGSRLYKEKTLCVFNCEDQLWEPNWTSDMQDLALDSNGESSNISIFTKTDPNKGLVDDANVLQLWDPGSWDPSNLWSENFYLSFINSMNEMVTDKKIAGWKALPYDWRLSFDQILSGGKEVGGKLFYDRTYATENPYILAGLRQLAQNSDSGKISIIAHSMGGLIVKKMLTDIEKNPNHPYRDLLSKVETVILVDSPQLGTPQAIASMLHGTGEDLPKHLGFFSNPKIGRALGQNMPSAYALLPSRDYTMRVVDDGTVSSTILQLDPSLKNITADDLFNASNLEYFSSKYGTTTIFSYAAYEDFLLGKDGHGSAPDSDLEHPKVLREDFFTAAQTIHDEIDSWQAPAGVRLVQIAGWGIPETIKGIKYVAHSTLINCRSSGISEVPTECNYDYSFDEEPDFTFDGDGVVTLPSQVAMGEVSDESKKLETYYVDLNAHNEEYPLLGLGFQKNRSHSSVLEVDDLKKLIKNVLVNKSNPEKDLKNIRVSKENMDASKLKKLLRLSLHSPVKVDVYDQNGNHLGLSASSTSERQLFDQQMPNSYYLKFGEGTYLGFPLEASTTIQLKGIGTGTFTLEMEQYTGDSLEKTLTFTNIPVVTTTKAVMEINTLSDAKELAMDQNGDGTIDSFVFTDENKKTITTETLKNEIQKLSSRVKPALLIEVVIIEKQLKKGNSKVAIALLKVMKKEFEVLSRSKIGNRFQIEKEEALRLSAIIDALVESVKN